ncbi:hypothetical protein CFter6_0771 [Collimonas fungivorans]|uniref:Uncharacterized protein n=1 Tax=Collimonas fungivorans TaxID=158899 RepID=A0A127P6Q8_9BURK|nr:hypothetical protein CFter6_0771 [Collimonas fungivorans]
MLRRQGASTAFTSSFRDNLFLFNDANPALNTLASSKK